MINPAAFGAGLLLGGLAGAQAPLEERSDTRVEAQEMDAAPGGLRLLKLHLVMKYMMAYSPPPDNYVFLLLRDEPGRPDSRIVWAHRLLRFDDSVPEWQWAAGFDVDAAKNKAVVVIGRLHRVSWMELNVFEADLTREIGRFPYSFDPRERKNWPVSAQPVLSIREEPTTLLGLLGMKTILAREELLISCDLVDRTPVQRYYHVNLPNWKWREVILEKKVDKQPPAVPGTIRWNEESTVAVLHRLGEIQKKFRHESPDNTDADYWTADLFGLYAVEKDEGKPYAGVVTEIARSDRFPLRTSPKFGTDDLYVENAPTAPASYNGYFFEALVNDEAGKPYVVGSSDHRYQNPSKFGFRAIPAEHGKTGTRTFQVNEMGVVYAKDLGLGAEKNPPRGSWEGGADPEKAGWAVVD